MNCFPKTFTINFDPHHICNYRCPYCFIPDKKKDNYRPFSQFSSVNKWIEAISGIEKKIHFSISGIGEPTLLEDFYLFAKGVSALENVLSVVIYSNMSLPKAFEPFFELNTKVHIIPSFHHSMVDFLKFTNMVYPYLESGKIPLFQNVYDRRRPFEEIEFWRKDILNHGYQLRLMPDFRLQNLSESELAFLGRYRYEPEWNYLMFSEKTSGKNCSSGENYIFLKNNGDTFRCAQSGEPVGNLLNNLKVFAEEQPCLMENCGTSIREFTRLQDNRLFVKDNIEVGFTIEVPELIRYMMADVHCFDFRMILYAILARKLSSDIPLSRPTIDMTTTEGLAAYFVTGLKPDIVTKTDEISCDYPRFGFAWADDLKRGNSIQYKLAFISSPSEGVSEFKALDLCSRAIRPGGLAVFGTASDGDPIKFPGRMEIVGEMHVCIPSEKLAKIKSYMKCEATESVVDCFSDMSDWLEVCGRSSESQEEYHVYLMKKIESE